MLHEANAMLLSNQFHGVKTKFMLGGPVYSMNLATYLLPKFIVLFNDTKANNIDQILLKCLIWQLHSLVLLKVIFKQLITTVYTKYE